VAEITDRLIDRGHDPAEVDEVVARLRMDRLLDDARVARAHARTASTIKGRGSHRIRRELEARGLSRHDAEAATAELSPSDEQAALERLIARATRGEPLDLAAEHRLFQRLIRRGFDSDAIRRALKGVRS
jgi:regulatory protein